MLKHGANCGGKELNSLEFGNNDHVNKVAKNDYEAKNVKIDIIELLLRYGANVNTHNLDGNSALHCGKNMIL